MRTLTALMLIGAVMAGCRTPAAPSEPPRSSLVRLEVLAGPSADDALPLVVAMHGLGDSNEGYAPLFRDYPGRARILVAQAPQPHGNGYSWFATRVRDGAAEVVAAEVAAAADEAAVLLAELMHRYPKAGKPVVTGFSQGGMMSMALAVRHPELVAKAVPVAGWLPEPLWPTELPADAPPIVALHGTVDTVLPYEKTERGIQHLKGLGWNAEIVAYTNVRHRITRTMRTRMYDEIESAR